jgi:hypothetical protein
MHMNYMITTGRARPKEGMNVIVRLKDKQVANAVYKARKFAGVPHEDVVSWLPKKKGCACEKLRWNKKSRKAGKCPSCGIVWRKVLDRSDIAV